MTVPERLETLKQLNGTIKKIKECSKPTIAAVEGGAAGAGVSLAMACDFLIMSDKSFFSCLCKNWAYSRWWGYKTFS